MKLYLNADAPDGRKFRVVNEVSKQIDYSIAPVRLYPEKPTEVSDAVGKRLLAQDPHLVSTKKYEAPEKRVNFDDGLDEDEKKLIMQGRANQCLRQIDQANGDMSKFSIIDIRAWAKKLEVDMPPPSIGKKPEEEYKHLASILIDGIENILEANTDLEDDIDETPKSSQAAVKTEPGKAQAKQEAPASTTGKTQEQPK